MAAKGIILKIGTEYTNKAMKSAISDLKKLDNESKTAMSGLKSFGNNLKSSVGPALAGVAAAAGGMAIAFGIQGVKAAAAEEKELAKLGTALNNLGFADELPAINEFIDRLQYTSAVSESQLRPAFQQLVTTTGDVTKAQDLLQTALDVSAGTGKDLTTVSAALSKGFAGNAGALSRLVPGLSNAAKASGGFAIAMGELNTKFGGQAAAAADTLEGRMKILTIAFDEAKESFGVGFLQGLSGTKGGISSLADGMVEMQPTIQEFGDTLGNVLKSAMDLIGILKDLNNVGAGEGGGTFGKSIVPIADTIALLLKTTPQYRDHVDALSKALVEQGYSQTAVNDAIAAAFPKIQQNLVAFGDFAALDLGDLTGQIVEVNTKLNEAARARQVDLFLFFHGAAAPGVGITSALNDFFTELYTVQEDLSDAGATVSEAAKKINPFKAWSDAIANSAKQATAKAKLMTLGFPAELADSVINMDGWKKVYERLLKGGSDTIRDFISTWSKGAEGQAAIGAQVDKITAQITSRLDKAKDAIDDFKNLSRDFAQSIKDFGAISTFQPDTGVPITAAGITANVRQRLAMVREFSSVLQQLQSAKVPLNQAALLDLVGMGPMEGLPYAKALLDAGASTISGLNKLQGQFVTPANIIGNIGAEASSGTTMAALQSATNFNVQAGAINITVNGEITAQTRKDIENAVTNAFIRVGQERRNTRRAGVK
jgi:hypothetical protein